MVGFDITDELLPWNNRKINILFKNGRCSVTDDAPDISVGMSIASLTTLLLGYKTAERLYEVERITGTREDVERLDDLLLHKIPYISDYI